jgi:hypothetical protein
MILVSRFKGCHIRRATASSSPGFRPALWQLIRDFETDRARYFPSD